MAIIVKSNIQQTGKCLHFRHRGPTPQQRSGAPARLLISEFTECFREEEEEKKKSTMVSLWRNDWQIFHLTFKKLHSAGVHFWRGIGLADWNKDITSKHIMWNWEQFQINQFLTVFLSSRLLQEKWSFRSSVVSTVGSSLGKYQVSNMWNLFSFYAGLYSCCHWCRQWRVVDISSMGKQCHLVEARKPLCLPVSATWTMSQKRHSVNTD